MTRIPAISTFVLAALVVPALADPGHLVDAGHGHTHWLALAGFAAAGVVAAGLMLRRRAARRRSQTEA